MQRRWKHNAQGESWCGDYVVMTIIDGEQYWLRKREADGGLTHLGTFRTMRAAKGNARVRMYEARVKKQ